MGGLETTDLNGTLKSDEPATITTPTQDQVSPSNQPGTPQDSPPGNLLVENMMIGRPWTTGLFDYHENKRNAFFPCVTFGQIAEVLDEGKSTRCNRSFIYFLLIFASYSQWICSTEYRTKLRKKFNLEEEPYTDVAAHIFCPFCALCQEFRELENRGFNPALGWKGIIVEQQGRQSDDEQVNVPPPDQVMSK